DLLDLALDRGFGLDRLTVRVARGLEVLVALLERVNFYRLVVLREQHGSFLCHPLDGERDRQPERQRCDKRGARIEAAEPPKTNHCSHVTPVGWEGKTMVPSGLLPSDYDQSATQLLARGIGRSRSQLFGTVR